MYQIKAAVEMSKQIKANNLMLSSWPAEYQSWIVSLFKITAKCIAAVAKTAIATLIAGVTAATIAFTDFSASQKLVKHRSGKRTW